MIHYSDLNIKLAYVCGLGERTLRRQNFDKTPDFRLEPAISK